MHLLTSHDLELNPVRTLNDRQDDVIFPSSVTSTEYKTYMSWSEKYVLKETTCGVYNKDKKYFQITIWRRYSSRDQIHWY